MSPSNFPTDQYPSTDFTESAGAILIRLNSAPKQVGEIRHPTRDDMATPQGPAQLPRVAARRSRQLERREPEVVEDRPRIYSDETESFMLTVRELDDGSRVKLIWRYIDVLDEEEKVSQGEFEAQCFSYQEVLDQLTFDKDRKVLVRAIDVVKSCQAT